MILLYQIKRDKRDKFRPPKKFFRIFKIFFKNPLTDEFTEKTDFLVLCDYRNNVLEKMPKSENYEGIGR